MERSYLFLLGIWFNPAYTWITMEAAEDPEISGLLSPSISYPSLSLILFLLFSPRSYFCSSSIEV